MGKRILFVCLGNICRSPSAEAVVRRMAGDRGLTVGLGQRGHRRLAHRRAALRPDAKGGAGAGIRSVGIAGAPGDPG
ncbi:hypothetical protein ABFB10_14070 [Ponticoccus litoralis]|uniref:Phosphotyrosine protein phosphatase I domain-containing protein n=1 Tax=Ponticoccus litoralis TaxID=422297 RepID=A0AAW9SS62_9RHOB